MNDTFMKTRPVFPLLLSMALPNVISMLVNSLYNIVDSLFVAQISEQAMTALSLVYPVQNMINAIAIGFGVGINALIALYSGAGDRCRADTAATHGLAFSINLERDFVVVPRNEFNSRIESLLTLTDLQGRLVSTENAALAESEKTIDYGKVNTRLAKERQKAKDYIESLRQL